MSVPPKASSDYYVLALSSGPSFGKEIGDILSLDAVYQLEAIRISELANRSSLRRPDIIVIEFQEEDGIDAHVLTQVRSLFGDVPLILVSDWIGEDHVHHLLKFHVDDWLRKPLDKNTVFKAFQSAIRTLKHSNHQVHAVVSGSAGAGATTAAVAIAGILCGDEETKKGGVALIDLDFSTGSCGYLLNMMNSYDLGSVVSNPSRIDAEFINLIKETHKKGFDLYSFRRPDLVVERDSVELVLRLLDAVNMQNGHTVLDIPYYETLWKSKVLAEVNSITILSELTLPSVKQTLEVISKIRELRGNTNAVKVFFNKNERKMFSSYLRLKQVRDLFENIDPLLLPRDDQTIVEASNRGILPSEVNSRSKFLKELERHVEAFFEMEPAGK